MNNIELHEGMFKLPSFQEVTNKNECYFFTLSSKIDMSMEDISAPIFRRGGEDITAGVWNDTEREPDGFTI